jgi:uncharacterized protein YbaP (TraB family)
MLRRFVKRVSALCALPLLLASPAEARTPQVARPALWVLSDADTTIYLFGTIHLLPDKLQWRTPIFDEAVDQAQQLVVETVVDQQDPRELQAAEFGLGLKQGLPPIAQRIPPRKLARLRAAIAKSAVPEKFFDQMKTWLAAIQLLGVQLREMGLKGSSGPEEILRQQFLAAHKPIGQLETPVEQFGYFDRLSEKAQRELLEGSIEPNGAASKSFDAMLRPWSNGDIPGIALAFRHELNGSPEIRRALLDDRNAHWSKWIEQRLAQPGTIIVAVGAGHLAGDSSVVAKLKADGFQVKRLQ